MKDPADADGAKSTVGEGLEQNCSDYFKLHAAYELAENQIRLADEVEDWLVEIRDKLQ